jgi:tetratricopeptide (TPR) repeat protein
LLLSLRILAFPQTQAQTEAQLRRAVEANSSDAEASYRLAEFYLHTGRIPEGIPFMEKAVALQPGNYVAGYDLALAYFDTREYDKARTQVRSMLGTKDTAELHGLLADVEEAAGSYLEAAAQYQRAARLEPSEDRIFDWATELIVHETYRPAITVFTRGIELYPRSLKMNVGLGIALYLDQQYEKSMKQLCAATDLKPSEAWPYLFLGSSYAASSSRFDSAEVKLRLKRFVSLPPENAKALYYYAVSVWDRDNTSPSDAAEAEKLLERAVSLDPSFADAHFQLGNLYYDRQDSASAIRELRAAAALDPNLASAHYHLSRAYARAGQADLSKQELATFQKLHKADADESQAERNRIVQFVVTMGSGGKGLPGR